jgi:hypothetical protein
VRLEDQGVAYATSVPLHYPGVLNNITIENITATATSNISGTLTGIPNEYASNININNIAISYPGGFPAVRSSLVLPEDSTIEAAANMFGDTIPAYGFYARHVKGLSINNACFTYGSSDKRPILYFTDVWNSTGSTMLDTSDFKSVSGGADTRCIDSTVLGIATINNTSGFKVYPNPNNGVFNIESVNNTGSATVEVYNMLGQNIVSAIMKSSFVTISIPAEAKAGIYFYRIFDKAGSVVANGKLVVQ